MNLSPYKKETTHYNRSWYLTLKISQSGLLLAIAIVLSMLCMEFMPKIEGFLQFDLGMAILIVALYIVRYWLSFVIAILHGFSTMLISGTVVGAFSNIIVGVTLISIWFLLTALFFSKKLKPQNKVSIGLVLGAIIIVTIIIVSVLSILANKYFLLHLYGFDNLTTNNHYLWYLLFLFNVLNLATNMIIFLITIPTIKKLVIFKR